MSIEDLSMGYWIKVTVTKSIWREQRTVDEIPYVVEADHDHDCDHGEEGTAEDVSSTAKVDMEMTSVAIPTSSKPNALPEGLVGEDRN